MFVVKTDCRMFIESAPTVEIMVRNPWTKQVRVRFKVSLHNTNNLGEGSHKDFLCDGDLNFKDKKKKKKTLRLWNHFKCCLNRIMHFV